MNSKQRRQAYRKLPKPGACITWQSYNGKTRKGVVVGPSNMHVGEHPKAWMGNGSIRKTKSTYRLAVRMAGGSVSHILASKVLVQP